MYKYLLLAACALALISCEKEIEVDLPETEPKLVVEGVIENGQRPLVILTKTQSYFAPTDINSISSIFVRDANVTVSDGSNTMTLIQLCSSAIPDSLLDEASELTGIDPALLDDADVCIYTSANPGDTGVIGRTYTLQVQAGNLSCSAVTHIPNIVAWDSTWWRLAEQDADDDSSGYIWGRLTEPDTLGNGYRHYARRIWSEDPDFVEDSRFISPLGTTFNDKYLNGLTLDLFAVRGRNPYTDNENDETAGFFLRGDSVIMKLVSMGLKETDFYITYDNNVASQGDLFSTPSNARTNINGGLGIWAGWAAYYDTLVCQ